MGGNGEFLASCSLGHSRTVILQQTLLGGINLVDFDPWGGDYNGVVVTNNIIAGGFASQPAQGSETDGTNSNDTVIKYVSLLTTSTI